MANAGWEQKLKDTAARIEQELRQAVKTVDDEVIPEVRKHGSSALRTLAKKMEQLAQHMDDARESPKDGQP